MPQIPKHSHKTNLTEELGNFFLKDTEFTIKELHLTNKFIKEGKSPGPENITTAEVLKRCNFDEIINHFLVMEYRKPKQL